MSTSSNSRLGQQTADRKMSEGFKKYFTGSVNVGSKTLAVDDLVKVFEGRVGTSAAAEAASVVRTDAVKADREQRAQSASLVRAARRLVQATFSESAEILAAFGLQPLRVGERDVATKAGAIAKTKATREARHTMGKKERLKIKGAPSTASSGPSTPPSTSTPGPTEPPPSPPVVSKEP